MASRRGRPFLKDTDEAEDVERGSYSPFLPPEETRKPGKRCSAATFSISQIFVYLKAWLRNENMQIFCIVCILQSLSVAMKLSHLECT